MKNNQIPKYSCMSLILLAAFMFFQSSMGYAEIIQGEVISVKPNENTFRVKHPKPLEPSVIEEINIIINPDTKFQGLSAVNELAAGDEVMVDAVQIEGTKRWEANAVQISKVKIHEP